MSGFAQEAFTSVILPNNVNFTDILLVSRRACIIHAILLLFQVYSVTNINVYRSKIALWETYYDSVCIKSILYPCKTKTRCIQK